MFLLCVITLDVFTMNCIWSCATIDQFSSPKLSQRVQKVKSYPPSAPYKVIHRVIHRDINVCHTDNTIMSGCNDNFWYHRGKFLQNDEISISVYHWIASCFYGSSLLWWWLPKISLQWRHKKHHYGVSRHQCLECLLKRFFRHRSKKT